MNSLVQILNINKESTYFDKEKRAKSEEERFIAINLQRYVMAKLWEICCGKEVKACYK